MVKNCISNVLLNGGTKVLGVLRTTLLLGARRGIAAKKKGNLVRNNEGFKIGTKPQNY